MPDSEIRSAAQTLYYRQYDVGSQRTHHSSAEFGSRSQSHSMNLISEDFISGYMEDGRMSAIRRFFCLFVTFDLIFISLLWIICVMITGDNIAHALRIQVLHYSIYTSLFDIVMAAFCRFTILILFYGLLYFNHWIVIAISTSVSCAFLISKVIVYEWRDTPEPVFELLLVVISFVLAWGEVWFLDCRVIPQERYARNYHVAVTTPYGDTRSPLLAPFLSSVVSGRTESVGYFSPYETRQNSDDEDEQDDEYKTMGIQCVRDAYKLLESDSWKVEKITPREDTIQSCQHDKLGKIFKLTGKVNYPAKKLLHELYYKMEEIPKWNPTLIESKIIRKIDSHTDISYQATTGAGGGMIKSRDFVNLRGWQLCRDGKVIEGVDINDITNLPAVREEDNEDSDEKCILSNQSRATTVSCSSLRLDNNSIKSSVVPALYTLSKSLGAKDFQATSDTEEDLIFCDAVAEQSSSQSTNPRGSSNVYVSAAVSIDYPNVPVSAKYTRGENKVSCWAMRELDDQKDYCIFEWLLCLDLKGYIPKYVLDTAYTTLMQEYMDHLRKHVTALRKHGKVPPSVRKS